MSCRPLLGIIVNLRQVHIKSWSACKGGSHGGGIQEAWATHYQTGGRLRLTCSHASDASGVTLLESTRRGRHNEC